MIPLRAVLLAGLAAAAPASAARAKPPAGMDFDRYVFAAVWEPGICAARDPLAPEACAKRTPKDLMSRQWTLHGLWADLPESLAAQGLKKGQWYKYGCYWFRPGHAMPKGMCDDRPVPLSAGVRKDLTAHMPGALGCLERHEFYKHAECYGFEPDAFF
ncbi:MAG: ribonuclease I, partial [Elusimicrobia bacterium]|nr:ribonuclease I [Elusimicrobiota bacterium]